MSRVTQARQDEITEALTELREVLTDVDVIYTDVTHVSRSGTFRTIRPFIITTTWDGDRTRPWDITYLVARAGIGKASQRHGGIEMSGCGMDMGFALVYEIGRATTNGEPWRCRGQRCGSNEHVNAPRVPYDGEVMHTADSGYRFRKETL